MRCFFFHCSLQDQIYLDPEGTGLPDLAATVAEAVLSAREMMADELRHGPMTRGRSFDIVGEDRQVLLAIACHDCLYRTP